MLFLFYEGGSPIGIFDFDSADTYITSTTVQGGMIGFFKQIDKTSEANLQLGDGYDEYGAGLAPSQPYGVKTTIRPATETNGITLDQGAITDHLVLLDDGHTGYGTMFGHQFGHESGSVDNSRYHAWRAGNLVGPNTLAGSGKVTAWFRDGLYGTDVYGGYTVADTLGVSPTLVPGTALNVATDSATTTVNSAMFSNDASSNTTTQAYFVSFLGDPSLVSTSFPNYTGADTANPIMLFMWKQ